MLAREVVLGNLVTTGYINWWVSFRMGGWMYEWMEGMKEGKKGRMEKRKEERWPERFNTIMDATT